MRYAALALLACSSAAPRPVAQPIFDRTIVLGERVGPMSLGMTEAQMFEAVGRAKPTPYGGSRVGYLYPNLKMHVAVERGVVAFIAPDDPMYATASGVHIGTPEPELVTKAGTATWRHVQHDTIAYCFEHTLVAVAGPGRDGPMELLCKTGQVCDIAVGGC